MKFGCEDIQRIVTALGLIQRHSPLIKVMMFLLFCKIINKGTNTINL